MSYIAASSPQASQMRPAAVTQDCDMQSGCCHSGASSIAPAEQSSSGRTVTILSVVRHHSILVAGSPAVGRVAAVALLALLQPLHAHLASERTQSNTHVRTDTSGGLG